MSSSPKHTQDRPFACPHEGCTKAFNRRDYLERHAANRAYTVTRALQTLC